MSSSEEEDLSKFNEAADVKLFNNSLYSNNKDAAESSSSLCTKTSLRYLDAPEENRTDLKVTPGFQKHVATKLMKILDGSIDTDSSTLEPKCEAEPDPNGNLNVEVKSSEKAASGGVRLFGASAAFIASCNITPPPPSKRRKRGRAVFMSSESEDDSSNNEVDNSNLSIRDSPDKAKQLGKRDEADLSEKFAACAVSSEWILNGEAVKGWAPPFKNKQAVEGECTPDVVTFISEITGKRKKKKSRKKRKHEDEPATIEMVIEKTENLTLTKKKRGKRGKKSKEKKEETGKPENPTETLGPLELELSIFPKKKKKKKKRSKHAKLEDASADDKLDVLHCLKKLKKKRRRKKAEMDALQGNLEDEGFDSDPIKSDNKLSKSDFKRELVLLTWLKSEVHSKKTKKETKWHNTLENLSEDLENPSTSDVKQD